MAKHDELDNMILGLLDGREDYTWSGIHFVCHEERPDLYESQSSGNEWRLTDRRLQALRKMGFIQSRRVMGSSLWGKT